MDYYINYNPTTGVTVNPFRSPEGYANEEVLGLVQDMLLGNPGSCPLDGALDGLQDGALWLDTQKIQSALEDIASAIHRAAE